MKYKEGLEIHIGTLVLVVAISQFSNLDYALHVALQSLLAMRATIFYGN